MEKIMTTPIVDCGGASVAFDAEYYKELVGETIEQVGEGARELAKGGAGVAIDTTASTAHATLNQVATTGRSLAGRCHGEGGKVCVDASSKVGHNAIDRSAASAEVCADSGIDAVVDTSLEVGHAAKDASFSLLG